MAEAVSRVGGEERSEPDALAPIDAEIEARRELLLRQRIQRLVRRRRLHRQCAQRDAPRRALHPSRTHVHSLTHTSVQCTRIRDFEFSARNYTVLSRECTHELYIYCTVLYSVQYTVHARV